MSTVQRPPGAIVTDLPAALSVIDLSDAEKVRRWAADLREQVDDAIGAGLDATSPPGQRRLGRFLAREQIAEAAANIERLFGALGLPSDESSQGERGRRRAAGLSGMGEVRSAGRNHDRAR